MTKTNRLDKIIRRQKFRLLSDSAFVTLMSGVGVIMLSVLV